MIRPLCIREYCRTWGTNYLFDATRVFSFIAHSITQFLWGVLGNLVLSCYLTSISLHVLLVLSRFSISLFLFEKLLNHRFLINFYLFFATVATTPLNLPNPFKATSTLFRATKIPPTCPLNGLRKRIKLWTIPFIELLETPLREKLNPCFSFSWRF